MTSQTNENALLKAGCILLMAAGAVCQGISVWNSLSVGRQTQNMEPEIYDTLNQAMQQTGGQAGADVAIQALQGLSVVMAVLCVVVLAVLLVVGLMGLKRIDKPEKYRFFLIWGIVLLVFGGIGALLVADFVSIRGIANLLWPESLHKRNRSRRTSQTCHRACGCIIIQEKTMPRRWTEPDRRTPTASMAAGGRRSAFWGARRAARRIETGGTSLWR